MRDTRETGKERNGGKRDKGKCGTRPLCPGCTKRAEGKVQLPRVLPTAGRILRPLLRRGTDEVMRDGPVLLFYFPFLICFAFRRSLTRCAYFHIHI